MKTIKKKSINVFNRLDIVNSKISQLYEERKFDDDLKVKLYSIIKDIDLIKNALLINPKAHWLPLAKKMSDEYKKDSSITRFLIEIVLKETIKHNSCSIKHSTFDCIKNSIHEE